MAWLQWSSLPWLQYLDAYLQVFYREGMLSAGLEKKLLGICVCLSRDCDQQCWIPSGSLS